MTEDIHLLPTQLHGMVLNEAMGKLQQKSSCFVLYAAAILQACASFQDFYISITDSNI
jgi:hypothetical protein